MSAWFQKALKGGSQLLRESILTLITLVSELRFLLGLPVFFLFLIQKTLFLRICVCLGGVCVFFSCRNFEYFACMASNYLSFLALYGSFFLVLLTSILQNEVRITLNVEKSNLNLFHVILRYINPGTAVVSGHIITYQSRPQKGM